MACADNSDKDTSSLDIPNELDSNSDLFVDAVDSFNTTTTCIGNAAYIRWNPLQAVKQRTFGQYKTHPSTICTETASSHNMVRRLKLQYKLNGVHEGCVNAINFSPCGTLLASGSDDLNIVVWKWMERRPFLTFDTKHTFNVFQARFMPESDSSVIVSAARDGQVRAHIIGSSGELANSRRVASHKDSAHKLAVDRSLPHTFLSCGEDGLIQEIDLRTAAPNKLLYVRRDDVEKMTKIPLYTIQMNPSRPHEFAAAGKNKYAYIFDKRMTSDNSEFSYVKKFCPDNLVNDKDTVFPDSITCLAYSYDGKELLCSYNDDDIYLFDSSHSSGSNFIKRYEGHRNSQTVKGVNFYGPHSEFIVSGSDCGHVFIWDKNSEKIVQCMEGDETGVVNCLEQHPSAPVLATSGLDSDVKIFMPCSLRPTSLSKLDHIVSSNKKARDTEREEDEENSGTVNDFYRIYYRRISRMIQRRAAGEDGENGDDNTSNNSDSEDSDTDMDQHTVPLRCDPQ
ncbi:DDB1- and CUL4-associated factor 8-like [Oopsacas minuta]|uniref:DDB1- and CUL4-associated factor 8-like n=1 Tax=Oopsacas minuta TaxID=111878 RepID=A0AAV7JCU9_9METZ|nr:DDB1- and CUL4-associated factor 8-like [Oopsacas minuta]